jgi:uncharacterized protein YbaP (TraB family)
MKKIILGALSLFAFGATAQNLENSLLWKISGNGLKAPSYLFGTIHVTCDATLDKSVLTALDATQQLYMEINMDDPNLQTQLMAGMMMPEGKTMSKLVTEAQYKKLNLFLLKNMGMSAMQIDTFKPAFVSMMLTFKLLDCPPKSIENELLLVSQKQNEEVFGLESVQDQIAAFDKIPYEEQMKQLMKSVNDDMAQDKAEFKKVMEIYNSRDLEQIMKFMNETENDMYSNNADVLLNERNKNWIPKIEKAAISTPTFFGVGAAHLAGEQGVIMLLRAKGYTVEAVK